MPELPEVESICKRLREGFSNQPGIIGHKVVSAPVQWPRSLAFPDLETFYSQIVGQYFQEITRRGKFLVFKLNGNLHLLIHLRMSGDLLVEEADTALSKHHRLTLELENCVRLAFIDPRKFGRIWLTSRPQQILLKLGPEPLDSNLSADDFFLRLKNHRRQLKPLLMDQAFIAGLGNIYADEALFLAHLHPLTLSDQVSKEQAEGLFYSIQQVLMEGIQRNGSSIDWVYRGGDFQNYFNVYQRNGEPCPNCGGTIVKIIVGQRGTHYCPNCQPFKGA